MQPEIKDFLKIVMKNNQLNENTIITQIKDETIYILDDVCFNHFYHKPTLLKIDNKITFNMNLEHALYYLENSYCECINEFNSLLDKYIKIYNEIRASYDEKEIEKYIQIKYDCDTNIYNVYFTFYKSTFQTRSENNNPPNGFAAVMAIVMRSDPDVIMWGELRYANYNEDTLLLKENGVMSLNNVITNLIYSSDDKPLDNMFTIDNNGKYKNNDMFNAIQSYFDITESTEYNILDPHIINDRIKLNESITLSRMVDI